MSCKLCDGSPWNAIKYDCGGCDQFDEIEFEVCDDCDELIDECTCEDEDEDN